MATRIMLVCADVYKRQPQGVGVFIREALI